MHALSIAAFALLGAGAATPVYFSNVQPRLDSAGSILDAHDGVILRDPASGLWLYYGMSYGLCKETPGWGCEGMWFKPHCGFQLNHSISLFTSPNLAPNGSWTFVRDVLPAGSGRPDAVYFRPQVVYNPRTSMWVLWVNAVPLKDGIADYSLSTYVVATANRPDAQFTVVRNSTATRYGGGLGDLCLFVDPKDNTGYVAYAAWDASLHSVSIERLTDDFLGSAAAAGNTSLSSGPVGPSMQEAPLLFESRGTYYLSAGHTCCFCPEGAASRVWSAPAPLGPWTEQGYIDPPAPGGGHGGLLGAQNSLIVALPSAGSPGGTTLVWAADRWLSAPDDLKGHDFQYWAPLVWNESTVPPSFVPLAWSDGFWLNVTA